MIQKELVGDIVNGKLEDTEYFLVSVSVSPCNDIVVEIDSDRTVDVDFCADLTRYIEARLDRDAEDFSLEVGSAGLTAPLKLLRQYRKNIGNDVEVVCKDGKKHIGVLKEVGDEAFVVTESNMIRKEGDKRKKLYEEDVTFRYDEIKSTKYIINCK